MITGQMRNAFLLLCAICLLCGACKFNPNFQGRGTEFVQGVWLQNKVAYQDDLLQFTEHRFKFTCDSFYVTLNTTAKANQYPDSCFNGGNWAEYVKGTYVVNNDTLYVNGTFTTERFKQKLSGCYRIGQYNTAFVVEKHSADTLYLKSLQQHLPVTLILKEKINCEPKPL